MIKFRDKTRVIRAINQGNREPTIARMELVLARLERISGVIIESEVLNEKQSTCVTSCSCSRHFVDNRNCAECFEQTRRCISTPVRAVTFSTYCLSLFSLPSFLSFFVIPPFVRIAGNFRFRDPCQENTFRRKITRGREFLKIWWRHGSLVV